MKNVAWFSLDFQSLLSSLCRGVCWDSSYKMHTRCCFVLGTYKGKHCLCVHNVAPVEVLLIEEETNKIRLFIYLIVWNCIAYAVGKVVVVFGFCKGYLNCLWEILNVRSYDSIGYFFKSLYNIHVVQDQEETEYLLIVNIGDWKTIITMV